MAETGYEEILAAFRAAARLSKERFLVGVAAASERSRVVAALAAEGEVIALTSAEIALERLAEESFELVVLDQGGVQQNILTAAREIRPFADVVPIIDGDPALAADMFTKEAVAVLPRPLPASDALFRAHLRYLASCRRARTRALMLSHVIAQNRAALRTIEPALEGALASVLEASQGPRWWPCWETESWPGWWEIPPRRAKPTSSWLALAKPIGSSCVCARPGTVPVALRW